MHLAYLKETRFPSQSLPDLPDQITGEIIEHTSDSEERSFLLDLQGVLCSIAGYRQRNANGGFTLASFRGPLQVALALSPVYLLSTRLLGNKVWNKRVLTDASCMLGNNKPSALLLVEKIIWNTLFLLADGQLDPREVLLRLNRDLPWADIRSNSRFAGSRTWFDPCCLQASSSSVSSVSVFDHCTRHGPGDYGVDGSRLGSASGRSSSVRDPEENEPIPLFVPAPNASQGEKSEQPSCVTGTDLPMYDGFSQARQPSGNTPLFLSCSEDDYTVAGPVSPSSDHNEHVTSQSERLPVRNPDVSPSASAQHAEGALNTRLSSNASDDALDGTYDPDGHSSMSSPSDHTAFVNDLDSTSSSTDKASISVLSSARMGTDNNGDLSSNNEEGIRGALGPQDPRLLRRSERLLMFQMASTLSRTPSDGANNLHSPPPRKRKKRHVRASDDETSVELATSPNTNVSAASGSEANPIDVDQLNFPSMWDPDELQDFRNVSNGRPSVLDRECSIPKSTPPPVQSERQFKLFRPDGTEVVISPSSSTDLELRRFTRLLDRVAGSYVDGKALHVAQPDKSLLLLMSHDEFVKLGPEEIQEILSKKCIVVKEDTHFECAFDRDTLNRIYPLHGQILLRGMLITASTLWCLQPLLDYSPAPLSSSLINATACGAPPAQAPLEKSEIRESLPRHRMGTLNELLCLENRTFCKVLSTSRVPMPQEDTTPRGFSTDAHAWHQTRGRPSSPLSESFPSALTRWAVARTAHVIEPLDLEPAGYNSFHTTKCGDVLYVFSRPSRSMRNILKPDDFMLRIDSRLDDEDCELEAILLSEGYTFSAQPCVVYCHKDSVVQGGYFYLSGLMQNTLRGLVADFVSNNTGTDSLDSYCPGLLRCVMEFYGLAFLERKLNPLGKSIGLSLSSYYFALTSFTDISYGHLPAIHTAKGLCDLLSVCSLLILSNVIDARTYLAPNQSAITSPDDLRLSIRDRFDRTGISRKERISMIYARGLAFEILQWITEYCEMRDGQGNVIQDFAYRFVSRVMDLIVQCKQEATTRSSFRPQRCTIDQLRTQLSNIASCDVNLKKIWPEDNGRFPVQLSSTQFDSACTVRWRDWSRQSLSLRSILQKGATPLDVKFARGELKRSAWDMVMAEDGNEIECDDLRCEKRLRIQR
ncbi:hypothetical protein CVT26_005013 [Gymnopilus dilepis]|uniref:Uncharacterized protein n=1 Tax=Gymnopilus dilepis TaxID=231916 RepID=A0A409W8D3_9AGAR|nr:hypothetical protein CVT26_005013 [Gymnopilus dilepis]